MFEPVISVAISDAVLAFSSLFGVFLMAQFRSFEPSRRMPATVALLAFGLVAAAAGLGTLRYGFSAIWTEPHQMLNQAANYLSPSLLAAAIAATVWNWPLRRQDWGSILLGLMACFELMRRLEWLDTWHLLLSTGALLLMTAAIITRGERKPTFTAFSLTGICAYFIGGLVIGTEGKLAGFLRMDLFHYLLALGNLCIASGFFHYLRGKSS